MENRELTSSLSITGRIEKRVHSVDTLRDEYPSWDSMDDSEKLDAVESVEPEDTESVYNVTTDRFHQYFVDNLDRNQTSDKDNIDTLWLAIGTDSATGTSSSDTDLNVREFQKEVTDIADDNKDLRTSTFIASDEGNGLTYNEIGLFSGDPANLNQDAVFMLNHATFSDVTKDNNETVTFDVIISFSDT